MLNVIQHKRRVNTKNEQKNSIRKENNMQTAKQCKSQTQQSSAHNLTVILTRRREL